MSLQNVKITDLEEISADNVSNKDLLLISHPIQDGSGDVDIPYNSNSINVQSLGNSLGRMPIDIFNCWNFGLSSTANNSDPSPTENLPRQGVQLLVSEFLNAMQDKDKRDSVINSSNLTGGWYMSLSTSVVEDPNNQNGSVQSLRVRNDVIPNIAFVHRMFAYFAKLIADGKIISEKAPSYVGQIIHSTTMNTEDKVKGFYGGEKWIEHKGYFLRGRKASGENVINGTAGQIPSSGQSITIPESYFKNFANHKHSYNNFRSAKLNGATTTSIGSTGSNAVIIPSAGSGDSSWSSAEHQVFGGTGSSGGGTGNRSGHDEGATTESFTINSANFIPSYKPVYIWERVQ